MDKKTALRLAAALVGVLVVAGLFQLASTLLPGGQTAGAASHTAAHFRSPAWPPLGGLGAWPLLLLPLFLAALYYAVQEGERLAGHPAVQQAPTEQYGSTLPPAGLSGKRIAIAFLVALVAAFCLKAFTLEPMVADEGRGRAMVRFLASFNRALIAKARFDEKAYVRLMAEALLADRPAFARFARSWYWAYFADEGVTRSSYRLAPAIATLEQREGRLTDPAAFELAKLYFENGMVQKAGIVVHSLLTRHPLDADYAEFEAALAAENEK